MSSARPEEPDLPEESEAQAAVDDKRERERAYRRAWAAANPHKVAAQTRRYAETHRDEIRARARDYGRRRTEQRRRDHAQAEREAHAAQRAERVREYQRSYREANRDQVRAQHRRQQRAWAQKQLATDPDGYRAKRNVNNRASWDRHREEYNFRAREKARDRARENPNARAEYMAAYREAHREELNAKRRAQYAANPRKTLDYNKAWQAREKRRIAVGLPTRRIRHTPTAERKANAAAADRFFTRPPTPNLIATWRAEEPTPPDLAAAEERRLGRLRALDGRPIPPPRMLRQAARDEQQRIAAAAAAYERRIAEAAEDARLDAIARAISARLRPPDPRRTERTDPTAPHVFPGSSPSHDGLNR